MQKEGTAAGFGRPASTALFLAGGGEMGAMMRAYDWSRSALGPVEHWPQSLRTAAAILLNSGYPMYLAWGREFVQLYNDAYRPILGSTKHPAALGAATYQTFAEIWDFIGPMFRRVMERGEASTYLDQLLPLERHGYAEECYFTFSYSAVRQEDGSVGGVFVTVLETTERVLRERRDATLRDLASGLRATSETEICRAAAQALVREPRDSPFALVYAAQDGRAVLAATAGLKTGCVAPATLDFAGESGGWAIGRAAPLTDPVQADVPVGLELAAPAWPEPVKQAVVVPILPAGRTSPTAFLAVGASPRRAIDRDYLAFCSSAGERIARALSEAAALDAERRRAESLAELNRAKTTFFSNISHEFRTPLTLMLGTLEQSIAAADLPASRREELTVAHRNSLRLLRMVNTLLDFSRVEAGRVEASYEPVDLAALTAELASNFRSACENAGLRLDVACDPLPEPAFVDRDMFEKIVLNLLSNAFKFTLQGAITVRLAAADGTARLTVSDTGSGVPKEHLPRLFERFHRVPETRSRTYEGTGIGLALVRELVTLHGGSVAVESEEGRGSSFTVSIPLGSEHLPAERIGATRRLSATSIRAEAFVDEAMRWLPDGSERQDAFPADREAAIDGVASVDRKRVLVVDDNADMRDYVTRLLRPFHDVDIASDGRAALAAIARRRPDLVLTDVMMPVLDGVGLVRAIRADVALQDLPVILLSARAGEEAQVEGLGAGADDYLVKPFSGRELLARIETNLKLAAVRNAAMAEIKASEERFRALVSASSDVVYCMSADWTEMRHLVGRDFISDTRDPSRSWLEKYIHEDDRPHVMAAIGAAIRGKSVFELEHRVRRVDGSYGWTFSRAIPVLDDQGRIVEWFGAASDVTERRLADERQKLLINELNHRVKNTLASVQSVTMQTLRNSSSLREFENAFLSRLMALSRVHDLLTRSSWRSASLRDLVRETLEPYADAAERVRYGGPEIQIAPAAALTLSMGLHELATNAAKYGALSSSHGGVAVDWSIDGAANAPALAISWAERDGPPVEAPRRRGFGTRLIERGIALDLDGHVALDFDRRGVQCLIRVPISDRISPA